MLTRALPLVALLPAIASAQLLNPSFETAQSGVPVGTETCWTPRAGSTDSAAKHWTMHSSNGGVVPSENLKILRQLPQLCIFIELLLRVLAK